MNRLGFFWVRLKIENPESHLPWWMANPYRINVLCPIVSHHHYDWCLYPIENQRKNKPNKENHQQKANMIRKNSKIKILEKRTGHLRKSPKTSKNRGTTQQTTGPPKQKSEQTRRCVEIGIHSRSLHNFLPEKPRGQSWELASQVEPTPHRTYPQLTWAEYKEDAPSCLLSMYVCIYLCMYLCIYVCIYVSMYVYVYI